MNLSIFSVYGNPRYVFKAGWTQFAQDGVTPIASDPGYRFRFNKWGKRIDPDTGDVVQGIRRPGLAQSSKARRNRALAELILTDAADDMRVNGYPEMTESQILDWWLTKHGGTRGIDWNVYVTDTGQLATDEEIKGEPPKKPQAFFDAPIEVNDEEFIVKPPPDAPKGKRQWRCTACQRDITAGGMNGHRRSKVHRENVTRLQEQNSSVAVGAV